jgi:16S rRNA (guanine527-N7)-methyltransferase
MDSAGAALDVVTVVLGRPRQDVAADLESFAEILAKWQRAQNLVSRETLADLWSRHIADSLQVLNYWGLAPSKVIDVGSGGGFPSLPLAIARKGSGDHFCLVESNGRKAAFLRTVVRELSLDAEIVPERMESARLPFKEAGIITSRAVAGLPRLLELTARCAGPETRLLLHKGREYGEELKAAAAGWHFDVIEHASATDLAAVILEIRDAAPRLRT